MHANPEEFVGLTVSGTEAPSTKGPNSHGLPVRRFSAGRTEESLATDCAPETAVERRANATMSTAAVRSRGIAIVILVFPSFKDAIRLKTGSPGWANRQTELSWARIRLQGER